MAENNVDATLEENRQLREQIETIQQERRRSFAEADRVHEEVLARQENERLKKVLASQESLRDAAEDAKNKASEGPERASQVPYTITKDGPVYSTPNRSKAKDEKPEEGDRQQSGPRQAAGTANRPPYVSLGGASNTADDVDENKEN